MSGSLWSVGPRYPLVGPKRQGVDFGTWSVGSRYPLVGPKRQGVDFDSKEDLRVRGAV